MNEHTPAITAFRHWRRTGCAVAILAAALASLGSEPAKSDDLDNASAKLDRPMKFLIKETYRQSRPIVIGKIAADERRSISVKLTGGVPNAIVAACGRDCNEVQMSLYDYRHGLVAQSNDKEDVVVKIGTPPYEGLYEIEIAAPGCHATECEVGLLVLRQEQTPQATRTVKYSRFENRDLNGGDIVKLTNIESEDNCASACKENDQCQAYSLDKWNRLCFLKSSISVLRRDPRSVTGVRDDLPAPASALSNQVMERYRHKAFPGEGYKALTFAQFESCETACAKEAGCNAYTFHKAQRTCHLLETTGEYFPDETADSGGKAQPAPVKSAR